MPMPKCFVIRHGETEWSLSGQHTGRSDIPLTAHGEKVMAQVGRKLVGPGKPIDPSHVARVILSPRRRAQTTYQLLTGSLSDEQKKQLPTPVTDERAREWDYGDYEGLAMRDIVTKKRSGKRWDIWTEGCPSGSDIFGKDSPGESVEQMQARVDSIISTVQEFHQQWLASHPDHNVKKDGDRGGDVIVVAHGHFFRAFIARWIGLPLEKGRLFSAEAGAVSELSYAHENLKEPVLQVIIPPSYIKE